MGKKSKSHRDQGRGPSQRQLRAGELVRHALADILAREDLREPALSGVSITVSEVRPSPDLRTATVFCAPLLASQQDGGARAVIVDALNRSAAFLRGRLGREIALKFTPQLRFVLDESYEEAARITALLSRDEVVRDLRDDDDGA